MGKIYKVVVKGIEGENMEINLCKKQMKSMTVLQLKEKITESFSYDMKDWRLIFAGRLLVDSKLLSDYGIKHMSIILMAARLRGGRCLVGNEDGGMGDKEGKNQSMENVYFL
ncbi:hypothetical protein L3Q82_016837 [Scortum barcoo]|uniref:Uncharacterized protein n=1 Tax=Scortum barcoo TaxID=214431 RepID=A0ACB8X8B8_9TELE|nr:hypothetical protein L3Q82_016837 [Scortum barcoo]